MHALVTLNVFQNSLRHCDDPSWQCYTNLLSRMLSKPVSWYMTEPDFDSACSYFNQFGGEVHEICQRAYINMLSRVNVYPVEQLIRKEAGRHPFSLADCIRLEFALQHCLDAIVTYEPHHFARPEDLWLFQLFGYFPYRIPSECAETGDTDEHKIMVFSVRSFLLNLDTRQEERLVTPPWVELFELQEFCLVSRDDINEAQIKLSTPDNQPCVGVAEGQTPLAAIQKAIDQVVDQWVEIPARRLTGYFIPQEPLSGADSPIKVMIQIECGDMPFEQSACSCNSLRAAALAYLRVINLICDRLKLPICKPLNQDEEGRPK